ncbi:MAG TPA: hypothetical protein VNJ09_08830 [Chthonomonadales bacterium]|nr:hypothetical protein [Chthonomonadales bacterium]
MIAAFEQRLADVLGTRLPAPFGGRVRLPPGEEAPEDPQIIVGVERMEPVDPDLGSVRPEIAPGSADFRRVMRLDCTVTLEVHPGAGGGRAQQMQGLDAALYALDASDFRDGSALRGVGDPGFLIQSLRITGASAPLDPTARNAPPVGLTLRAEGWFWPAGIPGEEGVEIGEVRVRGATLPILLSPAAPELIAGGAAVDFTLRFGATGTLASTGAEEPTGTLPFGNLALLLVGAGGRAGAGTLSGGTPGAEGVHLVAVTEGVATVRYTPPAEAVTDTLVVTLDSGAGEPGIELARFTLRVRET